MKTIAIFASGNGTNAENLIRYFANRPAVSVALVVCNKPGAGVIARAERLGVPVEVVPKAGFADESAMMSLLGRYGVEAIVLSGFLLLLPPYFIKHFAGRIVNIHPALLPKHCGKGMYGLRVHEDVLRSGDKESGITIHLADEDYDHGRTLFRATCPVLPDDTPETLAQRVHKLEYEHYPRVVEEWLNAMN